MASAYASLVSLVHVLIRVQHPTCPAYFDQLQIQSLLDKVNSLVDFLEAYSHKISDDFGRKMVHAAFAAKDTIETYVTDRILEESSSDAYDVLCQDLEKTIQGMDLIKEETKQVKEKNDGNDQLPLRYLHIDSQVAPSAMVKMVGCDDELNRLMGELTGGQPSRQIIPIVGMGGIGKTTLATNVYNHPSLGHHFDVKGWVTISQDFSVGKIIRPLLRDLGVSNVDSIGDTKLGDRLHKCLFGRRYLIMLDDIWDVKAWDEINRFCPDNNNKSRIMLTTRISDVGRNFSSSGSFDMKLLDDDKSWKLLSERVFGEEACPPELENSGKNISNSCKGLALAIVVVSGFLKMSKKTSECWEDVAQNIGSIIGGEEGERCLKILSLSYHQLPIHLKPCFLYLATYPYDREIRVSQVIKLWAADGFLRPNMGDITLEEVASKYLKELCNRNLIMIKRLTFKGEMKHFTVHDLVMDLCMREVQKERFLCVDSGGEEFPETIESQRRLVFHGSYVSRLPRFPRSYISLYNMDLSYISQSRLLRSCVLPGYAEREYLPSLVNLRLLKSFGGDNTDWFQKISLLWNLETLIVSGLYNGYELPSEIWKLPHIKHLIFPNQVILPDPPTSSADLAMKNLQTLSVVQILSDKVLDMIPNIKKMAILFVHDEDTRLLHGFGNLAHCQKLEVLTISTEGCMNLKNLKFPNSLGKLTLWRCDIPWEKCGVGLLPNLKVFRLVYSPFDDRKWNTVEGEFQKLKSLSLYMCGLESWTVEDCCHFPSLEHLNLRSEMQLEGIPEVFGESMTLQSIELKNCSHATVMSAKQLLDEQQSQGNYDLTVHVDQWKSFFTEEMRVDLLSVKTDNIHITFT